MNSIETNNYALCAGSGCGIGTYIIVRKSDNACTLRNTGTDAQQDYKKLLQAYNMSGSSFDGLCAEEIFYPDRTETFYHVEWSIDVYATSPLKAAEQAYLIQCKRMHTATVFDVTDESGKVARVDLLESEVSHA